MTDQVECPICIEFYSSEENDKFVMTLCGHLFHKSCLERALFEQEQQRCPVDRQEIQIDSVVPLHGIMPYKCEKKFKIITLGDAGVGKTSLLTKYCEGIFSETIQGTIGVEFKQKVLTVGNELVKLAVYDTSGQEKFNAITSQFVRDSQGVIIMYDIMHPSTLKNCEYWLDIANQNAPSAMKILVGTKGDMEACPETKQGKLCGLNRGDGCRKITLKEAQEVGRKLQISVTLETSAKNNYNVEFGFRTLAGLILENRHLVRDARLANRLKPVIRIHDSYRTENYDGNEPNESTGSSCYC